MEKEESHPEVSVLRNGFSSLGLREELLRAVTEKGYTEPTEIQLKAIPIILSGRDLTGTSQTGTGKTAAFALPILHRLSRFRETRCLVLEPTRELAQQVSEQFSIYGKFTDVFTALVHGGVGYVNQLNDLSRKPEVVVATPGRLLDHMGQGKVNLKKLDCLVLDEVDRMLDMGFLPDVRRIVGRCPRKRQTLLFSATVPDEIQALASWVLYRPEKVDVGASAPAETVSHAIYPVDNRQKFDLLLALLKKDQFQSVLIFCRTKAGADAIARWLQAAKHSVATMHSNRSQRERNDALAGFKKGTYEILVATDIVSRGIDIADVSHVINYDIPHNPEDYVHRIGRTGRMYRDGDAVTLFCAGESDQLRAIERFIGKTIEREKLEDFEYAWSPILEEEQPVIRRRNRGFHSDSRSARSSRRRR